jgi:drug/metabolite transporter (DMT)-like permease
MTLQLTAILSALVTLFCFGLSNGMQKRHVLSLGSIRMIAYRAAIIVVCLIAVNIAFWERINWRWEYILFGATVAAVSYFGLYFVSRGMEYGKVGVIVPISSARVLVASLVGLFFLNERLSGLQWFMLLLTVGGVVLSSINISDFKDSKIFSWQSGIPYALLAALFWGCTFALFGIPSAMIGALFFSLILEAVVGIVAVIQGKLQGQKIAITRKEFQENWKGMLIIGLIGAIGSVFLNVGYATGQVSIVTAVSSASPLIATLYGRIVYGEQLSRQQYLAVILIVFGIIGLSLA